MLWVGFGHVGKSGSSRANNERVGHESPDRSLFRPSSSHRPSHAPGPFLGQVCGFGGLDWPRAGTTLSRGTAHVVASLLIVWPPCANVRIGTPVPPRCDRVLDFDLFPPASRTFRSWDSNKGAPRSVCCPLPVGLPSRWLRDPRRCPSQACTVRAPSGGMCTMRLYKGECVRKVARFGPLRPSIGVVRDALVSRDPLPSPPPPPGATLFCVPSVRGCAEHIEKNRGFVEVSQLLALWPSPPPP